MNASSPIIPSNQQQPWSIGFCGTGPYSVQCARALHADIRFQVTWVVTPPPKPVGRHNILTPSPLDAWATERGITVYHVGTKLNNLEGPLTEAQPIDFLLVVSFGYLIPDWLLHLPKIAPVNVHPSAIPLYRGSSPGQFALLYGETESAVSIMEMNTKFDQGAVIRQLPLPLLPLVDQQKYYDQAFSLAAENLPQILQEYAKNPVATAQASLPAHAPLARRLKRDDGFIPWSVWQAALSGEATWQPQWLAELGPVLAQLQQSQPDLTPAALLDRAVRALTPWPGVWTLAPEYKGKSDTRLKILSGTIDGKQYHPIRLQYEGEPAKDA